MRLRLSFAFRASAGLLLAASLHAAGCSSDDSAPASAATSTTGAGGASSTSSSTGEGGAATTSTSSAGGAGGAGPACDDGAQNGDETGIDCGGSCAPCVPCDDGLQNGDETDVDCGGSCAPCANGDACVAPTDCASHGCKEGVCGPWSRRFVGVATDFVSSLAIDPVTSNIVVAGNSLGSIDLGNGMLANANPSTSDAWVVQMSPSGDAIWSKILGGVCGFDVTSGCAIGADQGVFVGGILGCSADLGGGALPAVGHTGFLVKYGADGAHRWSRSFDGSGDDSVTAVALDAQGNVVVAGTFASNDLVLGEAVFGGGAAPYVGQHDVFVAALSAADGSPLWAASFGGLQEEAITSLALDPGTGDLVAAGWSEGSILTAGFGAGASPAHGKRDVLLARIDHASGAVVWSKRFGAAGQDQPLGLAVDGAGHVAVTGAFDATLSFGGDTLPATTPDAFVALYAVADGSHVWSRRIGDTGDDQGNAVAFDPAGDVHVAGLSGTGAPDFGGGPLTAGDQGDAFLATYGGAAGDYVSAQLFATPEFESALGIKAHPTTGNIVAIGRFHATLDVGAGEMTTAGSYDVFIGSFGR